MNGGWGSWEGQSRLPPGSYYSPVPQWERRFCTNVCKVRWDDICSAKLSMSSHKNVANWDDSAALEAFQNAKARYWAEINHNTCDIPLPDPDIYIDEVDHDAVIDPKLVEDLDKTSPPPSNGNNEKTIIFDSLFYSNCGPVSGTGWENKYEGQSGRSANWDVFIDKETWPDQSGGDWQGTVGWGCGNEPVQSSGWGDAEFFPRVNQDGGDMWNRSYGRGGGTRNTSWNNNQGRNRRKRNEGNYDGSRFSKPRHRMSNYQTHSDSWRERNVEDSHYEKTRRTGQAATAREWGSKRHCGRKDHDYRPESGAAWSSWKKSVM